MTATTEAKSQPYTTLMLSKGDLDELLAALNERETALCWACEEAGGPASKKLYGQMLERTKTLSEDLSYARLQLAA